jgi:Family of unknown function (DUF5324)
VSAKTSTPSSRLGAVQPWIRDHYATLRKGAAPRLSQTRAVVVPVVVDATHRVREELLPAAAEASSRIGTKAMQRSAPARAEAMNRANAVLAAARGQAYAEKMAKARSSSGHKKLWFMLCATVTGAAAGVALVLWQRSRSQDWVEDDAVHTTLEHNEHDEHDSMQDASPVNADDPSDLDAGAASDQPRTEHHARH